MGFFMVVRETGSRVFQIEHSGNLETAFDNDGRTMPVSEGRGLYLVRLELPTGNNPELINRAFGVNIRTNKDHITYSKGLGGGKRGFVGEPIPFEMFITSAVVPIERAARPINLPAITEIVNKLFGDMPYDCNVNVCTEFEGYRAGLGPKYDELRTHLPLIVEALNELSGKSKL